MVSQNWVVVLLLVVAVVHAWRVNTLEQSPWKGGGFGMFSTLDGHKNRFARIYVTADGQQRLPVVLEPQHIELVEQFIMAPTEAAASRCLRQLDDLTFRRTQQGQVTASLSAAGTRFESDMKVSVIELEYWKIDFDAARQTMTSNMVRGFRADL